MFQHPLIITVSGACTCPTNRKRRDSWLPKQELSGCRDDVCVGYRPIICEATQSFALTCTVTGQMERAGNGRGHSRVLFLNPIRPASDRSR